MLPIISICEEAFYEHQAWLKTDRLLAKRAAHIAASEFRRRRSVLLVVNRQGRHIRPARLINRIKHEE